MGLEDRFGKFVGVVVFGEDTDVEVLDCDDTLVCEGSLRVHSDLEVRGSPDISEDLDVEGGFTLRVAGISVVM